MDRYLDSAQLRSLVIHSKTFSLSLFQPSSSASLSVSSKCMYHPAIVVETVAIGVVVVF